MYSPSVIPSVHPFVCCQSYEHDILKMKKKTDLVARSTEQGGESVNFGVRGSKVKVT